MGKMKFLPVLDSDAPWLPPKEERARLLRMCCAEVVGTWILVWFGIISVTGAVVIGSLVGIWQVGALWGFGGAFGIYVAGGISGGHLNPAVSLAFFMFRPEAFPKYRLVPYMLSQIFGGVLAGLTNLAIYGTAISDFEDRLGIVRGEPGSELSSMNFNANFPNPALVASDALNADVISSAGAMGVEAFGTAFLMLMIASITDSRNPVRPTKGMEPYFIGFVIGSLVALFGPLTQGCWNPARDFGPRLVTLMAGWGSISFPGYNDGFWVYWVGPCLGAPVGIFLYDLVLRADEEEAPKGREDLMDEKALEGETEEDDDEKADEKGDYGLHNSPKNADPGATLVNGQHDKEAV